MLVTGSAEDYDLSWKGEICIKVGYDGATEQFCERLGYWDYPNKFECLNFCMNDVSFNVYFANSGGMGVAALFLSNDIKTLRNNCLCRIVLSIMYHNSCTNALNELLTINDSA